MSWRRPPRPVRRGWRRPRARPPAASVLRLPLVSPETSLTRRRPTATATPPPSSRTSWKRRWPTTTWRGRCACSRPPRHRPCPRSSPTGGVHGAHLRRASTSTTTPPSRAPRELVAAGLRLRDQALLRPEVQLGDLYIYESLKLPGLTGLRERALATQALRLRRAGRGRARARPLHAAHHAGRARPALRLPAGRPGHLLGAVAREVVEFTTATKSAPTRWAPGAFRLKSWRRGVAHRARALADATAASTTTARRPTTRWRARSPPACRARCCRWWTRWCSTWWRRTQPRWLSFLNGSHAWLGARALRPAGRAQRASRPTWRAAASACSEPAARHGMSFFFMDHPLVGGYTPDKVALRRAIGLAFDGDAYIRRVLGGFGLPAQSTMPPFTSGYDPAYKSEMSDYSPARAKACWTCTATWTATATAGASSPTAARWCCAWPAVHQQLDRRSNELWKRCMDAVGLKMEFDDQTWPELLKKSRAGTLMMWGYAWSAASPDGGFFLAIAYGPNASESNDPRFMLPAFDRLFERQRVMPDGPEREAVMRQAKEPAGGLHALQGARAPDRPGPGAALDAPLLAPPLHARHLALRGPGRQARLSGSSQRRSVCRSDERQAGFCTVEPPCVQRCSPRGVAVACARCEAGQRLELTCRGCWPPPKMSPMTSRHAGETAQCRAGDRRRRHRPS
jgi:hypothetical protein